MKVLHPRRDDAGTKVWIGQPHASSPAASWSDASVTALWTPDSPVPSELNGVPVKPWTEVLPEPDAPTLSTLARAEPLFVCPTGFHAAAGAVVVEPDGRLWCVAPSNRFGGHEFTFPKGRLDPGCSLHSAAVRETFEESGLCVRLDAFLIDVARKQTFTRFYVARRFGGSPSAAGWESQCVTLAPIADLRRMLTHPGDQLVLDAVEAMLQMDNHE
jgi:8-oxo-dGTP pyrophosphatase MutT (NUDIX family)